MHQIDERLIEEVRKYENLYDFCSPDYKDCQMAADSWKEISANIGIDVTECTRRWKNLRDKYVRLRKRVAMNGEIGRRRVPAFYLSLSWLAPYVKHRDVESSKEDNSPSPKAAKRKRDVSGDRLMNEHDDKLQKQVAQFEERRLHKQVAQLEERRVELEQKLLQDNDELSRFGQTVADMLRKLPEEQRPQAMFDVHKLLFERHKECQ